MDPMLKYICHVTQFVACVAARRGRGARAGVASWIPLRSSVSLAHHSATSGIAGNTQQLHVQASIPQLNVIISLVGVALVVAGAIVVAVFRKRTSNAIAHAVDVEVVAEAMFNKAKFPPVFLSTALREDLTNAEQDVLLDHLRLQRIELVSAEELSDRADLTLTVNSSPRMTQAA